MNNISSTLKERPDTMVHTAAPWASKASTQARGPDSLQLGAKDAPELIAAQPAMPPVCVDEQGGLLPEHTGGQTGFRSAQKRITTAADMRTFLESPIIKQFVGFILFVNNACTGKKLSAMQQTSSPAIQQLVTLLDTLGQWVNEIPPVEQSLRYGNPAFRTWHARLVQQSEHLMASVLPSHLQAAALELASYLADSFGNATRIDYGTGHETTFVALLFCLTRLGVLKEDDCQACVGLVFAKYITLMRCIQTTYWLEPAGSHGVWGLDDYQFLPFIWGSAQLISHPMIRPKSIHTADVLEAYAPEYLYLAAVKFVKQVKKGPLQETSPMISDISAVPNWQKVNTGMIKMYQVEVLSKFPIMQHFLFGSMMPWPELASNAEQN